MSLILRLDVCACDYLGSKPVRVLLVLKACTININQYSCAFWPSLEIR